MSRCVGELEYSGAFAARLLAGFLAVLNGLRYFAVSQGVVFPERAIVPFETVLYAVLYVVFLRGVGAFALRRNDAGLVGAINALTFLGILEIIVLAPYGYAHDIGRGAVMLMLFVSFPLFVAHGVVLLRLAKRFKTHLPELGSLGMHIVIWNRVAGVLLVSVVCIVPGVFVSAIADVMLWVLLEKEARKLRCA